MSTAPLLQSVARCFLQRRNNERDRAASVLSGDAAALEAVKKAEAELTTRVL